MPLSGGLDYQIDKSAEQICDALAGVTLRRVESFHRSRSLSELGSKWHNHVYLNNVISLEHLTMPNLWGYSLLLDDIMRDYRHLFSARNNLTNKIISI